MEDKGAVAAFYEPKKTDGTRAIVQLPEINDGRSREILLVSDAGGPA